MIIKPKNEPKTVLFIKLDIGAIFISCDSLYIKTNAVKRGKETYNSVSLRTGKLATTLYDCPVTEVEAELLYEVKK